MFTTGSTTSADVCGRLVLEEQVINDNAAISPPTALAAVAAKPPRPACANCKRTSHRTEFCISAGGQMAGKTIEEARAAQDAARNAQKPGSNRPRGTRNATPAPTPDNTNAKTLTVNGQCYMLVTPNATPAPTPPPVDPSAAFAAIAMPSYDEEEYLAMLAIVDNARTSVDWNTHTHEIDPTDFTTEVAYSVGRAPITHIDEMPFILDSGSTCHISPHASDFKILHSTPRHPVKGLSGSAVFAVGVGEIELRIAAGHVLKLTDVLYIPDSSVRLISVLALNRSGDYTTHFNSTECWVTNKSNTTTVRGSDSESKRLYVLTTKTPSVQHCKIPNTSTTLYMRIPDLETWHRRLGHCNTRSIVEMAKNGVSQGMPIDLSSLPPNCDHCALGKQSRTPVPKSREGPKATKRLERVYVDLCGPMAILSKAGNLYSMNVIDDYSGYVWTLPLRSKADACTTFRTWHKAVTIQTGETLRILVSDNGELISKSMRDFCLFHGIDHQQTAPYTSTHNGRAERLHRTILAKARTMRLACNAPPFLWDEFCATATYLTTLTAATANKGRTPYELWFNRKPCLSHLREIGCHAHVLHLPTPSKIHARSHPYVLIGYAPHAKAYRLWDPATSRIVNSYHVTFTERLDAQPSPLHPSTTLGTDPASSPPSWDVPGLPSPSPASPAPQTSPFSILHDHPTYADPQLPPITCDTHTADNVDPSQPPSPQCDTSNTNVTPTNQDDSSRNTVTPSSNNSTSRNNVHSSRNNEETPTNTVISHTVAPPNHNITESKPTIPHPLTITIPPCPPLRRSARIQALSERDHTLAFLAEYSSV